jgi:hypothetical protein
MDFLGNVRHRVYLLLSILWYVDMNKNKNTLRGLSPRADYTDRATAACRRS